MKSKVIALSAIASAFVAICLTIGAYIEFTDLFALVVASVFVILPLYLKSYKGSVLTYLVGGVLAFLCSSFNIMSIVFPAYFAFFGIYPIVKSRIMEKNFNKVISFILCLIWCLAVCYGIYFYYTLIMGGVFDDLPEFIEKYILVFVGVLGVVFFIVYDFYIAVMRKTIDRFLSKIVK